MKKVFISMALVICIMSSLPALAYYAPLDSLYLSTLNTAAWKGITFNPDEVVMLKQGISSKVFDGTAMFQNTEEIDAIAVRRTSTEHKLYLSSATDLSINAAYSKSGSAISFNDGDVFIYDVLAGKFEATPALTEGTFNSVMGTASIDIDAFAFRYLPGGGVNYLISLGDNEGGSYNPQNGDILEWNPTTNSFVGFYLDWSVVYGAARNISAVDLYKNENLLFSVGAQWTWGGTTYEPGDVIERAPDGSLSKFFQGSTEFGGVEEIAAFATPIPRAVWLFASGLIGLAGLRKRFQN